MGWRNVTGKGIRPYQHGVYMLVRNTWVDNNIEHIHFFSCCDTLDFRKCDKAVALA
jgi:hypothetical protein